MTYSQEQYDALLAVCRSYKQEVERLTEERNRYAENLAKYQMASDKEIIAQKEEAEKRFENNMKSVLEIEKKQAVKEFAEKLKDYINDKVVEEFNDMAVDLKYFTIDIDEFEEYIDELLKEYEE